MTLLFQDLTVWRGARQVLSNLSLTIGPGECIGLVGPNGAGKTTALRAALGLVSAQGHSSIAAMPAAERAARVAWMAQSRDIAWPVSVAHLVALGAAARGRAEDHPTVDAAIARLGLEPFRDRAVTTLSGGEQARVLLARALAQDTPFLLADEPIAGLDPAQQIRSMRLFHDLAAEGRGVVVSLHDIALAARFCTRILVLDQGHLVADGAPRDVLTPDLMGRVFGVSVRAMETEEGLILHPVSTVTPDAA